MNTFTPKLAIGAKAFTVSGHLDPVMSEVTVGQLSIIAPHPVHRLYKDSPIYEEKYMGVETGVGCGTIWTYGTNIFATKEEAEEGLERFKQAVYKERQAQDKRNRERAEEMRAADLRRLESIAAAYPQESAAILCGKTAPLFRYIILTEAGDVYGTNNEEHAKECALNMQVWDVVTGKYYMQSGPVEDGSFAITLALAEFHTNPVTGAYWSQE